MRRRKRRPGRDPRKLGEGGHEEAIHEIVSKFLRQNLRKPHYLLKEHHNRVSVKWPAPDDG
jgi:hypothetical protein